MKKEDYKKLTEETDLILESIDSINKTRKLLLTVEDKKIIRWCENLGKQIIKLQDLSINRLKTEIRLKNELED